MVSKFFTSKIQTKKHVFVLITVLGQTLAPLTKFLATLPFVNYYYSNSLVASLVAFDHVATNFEANNGENDWFK